MQIRLKKYQYNWILPFAAVTSCLGFLFMLYVFFFNNSPVKIEDVGKSSFFIAFLSSVIIAPIIEEICFRGLFRKKRLTKLVALVGLILFVFFSNLNYLTTALLVVVISSAIIYHNNKFKDLIFKILVISSALLFSVLHFKVSRLLNFETIYAVLLIFSFGLVAIWVTINFSLFRAMLLHASSNFIIMLIIFIAIQFPDKTINNYENTKISIEWRKESLLNSNRNSINYNNNKLIADNTTPLMILKMISRMEKEIDTLNSFQVEPFMRYNFNITFKDSTNNKYSLLKSFFITEEILAKQ